MPSGPGVSDMAAAVLTSRVLRHGACDFANLVGAKKDTDESQALHSLDWFRFASCQGMRHSI